MGTCKYCAHYINSSKRTFVVETDKTKSRLCVVKNKFVRDTGSCDSFQFNSCFWCKRWEFWVAVPACISRRVTEMEDCLKCVQGREVSEIRKEVLFRKRAMEKAGEIKPRLAIRKREEEWKNLIL